MKGIREIKKRIKSVKNTAQITKAMQLVAASKMKRAQDAAIAARPYALLLSQIIQSLGSKATDLKHPLFVQREVKKRGILVISTDKGLCGALNANLFKHIIDIDKDKARFVAVGRKAQNFLTRSKRDVLAHFSVSDQAGFSEIRMFLEFMLRSYKEGQIDTIEILFTSFVNTLSQEAILEKLVPIVSLEEGLNILNKRLGMKSGDVIDDERSMLFEPDVSTIVNELPELFIKQQIYQMVLEAKASEHSARMVAMKTATDNAGNLVDDLTLEYNKARQAAITQEILEIAAANFASA